VGDVGVLVVRSTRRLCRRCALRCVFPATTGLFFSASPHLLLQAVRPLTAQDRVRSVPHLRCETPLCSPGISRSRCRSCRCLVRVTELRAEGGEGGAGVEVLLTVHELEGADATVGRLVVAVATVGLATPPPRRPRSPTIAATAAAFLNLCHGRNLHRQPHRGRPAASFRPNRSSSASDYTTTGDMTGRWPVCLRSAGDERGPA
jgi:hypothetical protein